MRDEIISNFYPSKPIYKYCIQCRNKAWLSENHRLHDDSTDSDFVSIEGVFVALTIVDEFEEAKLVKMIDTRQPWCDSQEGRCKQDYGPKVSFLQQKVALGNFCGFPDFAHELMIRLKETYSQELGDFIPVELCFLEYRPDRNSYIRPHFDDKWIWGDRLVTVNLLSDTCLRLTREFNSPPVEIRIAMPAKSLIIIYGEARNEWLHSIDSYDVKERRVAMTWREFGNEILAESQHKEFVEQVFKLAQQSIKAT